MEQHSNDFTQGSIAAKLLTFMLPVLGALVLQAMYGAVDILVVGWFGTTAGISGVSTGSGIVNLVTFTVTGLSMGITVLIGRYIGEKREERVGRVIGGAVCFFAVLSVAIAAVMLMFARQLSILMQAPEEAVDLTASYVRICGGGILFIVAYNVISSIFRGLGNSRLPLVFVAIACAVNVVGDLLFVAVFKMNGGRGGPCHCACPGSERSPVPDDHPQAEASLYNETALTSVLTRRSAISSRWAFPLPFRRS